MKTKTETNIQTLFIFLIGIGLLLALTTGCESDEERPEDFPGAVLSLPYTTSVIDDGKITIFMGNEESVEASYNGSITLNKGSEASIETKGGMMQTVRPDYIELYVGPNTHHNELVGSWKNWDNRITVTLDNQKNGTPVYFYLKAYKKHWKPRMSDVYMVIPDSKHKKEELLKLEDESAYNIKASPVGGNIAYLSRQQQKSLILFKAETNESINLSDNVLSHVFSPDGKQLIFSRTQEEYYQEGNDPSFLISYDIASGDTTHLLEQMSQHYQLSFKADDNNKVVFKQGHNVISLNLLTGEEDIVIRSTDVEELINLNYPQLIDDKLMIGQINDRGFIGFGSSLYEIYPDKKDIKPMLDGEWDESNPVVSPDGTKIAFISSRSGSEELWIYDRTTKKLTQLSGHESDLKEYYISESISWMGNDRISYGYYGHGVKVIYLK